MVSEQYDKAINGSKEEFSRMASRSEAISRDVTKTAIEYIIQWSHKLLEESKTDYPEIILELGEDRIRELKQEHENIILSYDEISMERFDDVDIWPHRLEISDLLDMHGAQIFDVFINAREKLNEAVKELIGITGELLIRYGLVKKGSNNWKTVSGKKVVYAFGLTRYDATDNLDGMWKAYQDSLKQFQGSLDSVRKAIREKEAAEAKDLWDQA